MKPYHVVGEHLAHGAGLADDLHTVRDDQIAGKAPAIAKCQRPDGGQGAGQLQLRPFEAFAAVKGLPGQAGQAFGQKNTTLAIWMAQVYLLPVVSMAPAAYIIWQNLFNSIQLSIAGRRANKKGA